MRYVYVYVCAISMRMRLCAYLQRYVNVFRKGTLNAQPGESQGPGAESAGRVQGFGGTGGAAGYFTHPASQSILFGTVSGSIGTIIPVR